MKRIMFLIFVLFSNFAIALDTVGYVKLKEVKAWDSTIDVYFEDAQHHQCPSESHKTRFLADSRKSHHVSFLLTAFASGKFVSLSYKCQENGHPMIVGIRVR